MKKHYLLFLFIFLFCGISFAQNPAIELQKSLGGSNSDYAYSICQTTDGDYIVAGCSKSNDGDVSGHHGSTDYDDYWVVKMNSLGVIQWQKSLGGSSYDNAYSVHQTTDGGYIVAGSSYSNDGDVTGHHGTNAYSDIWIIKLNSSGTIDWQKSLGGSSYDYAYSVHQTTDGGYIVAGNTMSSDGDVTGHHGVIGSADYWIIKLNSSGIIQWQKCYGGSYNDLAHSIQQTSDGDYIVAGHSYSNDGDVTGNHGSSDYWIVKISSTGVIQWQKSIGGSKTDFARSIQQTTDGGYIIAGGSESIDGDITGNHGEFDYWIVKVSSTGVILWQKSLGGSHEDNANSIQLTTDGGYIVAGWSYSNDGEVSGHHNTTEYTDYWVVKLNSLGVIQWQKSLGGSSYDYAKAIMQTTDGGNIIAGYSESNDEDVSGNHGSSDYWIVKLKPNVGIEEMSNGNETILIYPNPANSFINIKLQEGTNDNLSIYNNTGQVIMKLQNVKQNNSIDISKLPTGLYYIKVQSNKGIKVGKFLKQ